MLLSTGAFIDGGGEVSGIFFGSLQKPRSTCRGHRCGAERSGFNLNSTDSSSLPQHGNGSKYLHFFHCHSAVDYAIER